MGVLFRYCNEPGVLFFHKHEIKKKECHFEIRVPFVAIVPQGTVLARDQPSHLFGLVFGHLDKVGQGGNFLEPPPPVIGLNLVRWTSNYLKRSTVSPNYAQFPFKFMLS